MVGIKRVEAVKFLEQFELGFLQVGIADSFKPLSTFLICAGRLFLQAPTINELE